MPEPFTTIRALESALTAALIANEAEAVGALFAEDWVYVTQSGPVKRAEILGAIADGRLQHFSFDTIGAERLVVQGGMAIFTSHEISTGAWEGVPYRTDEWITDIWVRGSDGKWLCVMSQKTDVGGLAGMSTHLLCSQASSGTAHNKGDAHWTE